MAPGLRVPLRARSSSPVVAPARAALDRRYMTVARLLGTGRVDTLADDMLTFDQLKSILGLDEIMSLRDRLSSG